MHDYIYNDLKCQWNPLISIGFYVFLCYSNRMSIEGGSPKPIDSYSLLAEFGNEARLLALGMVPVEGAITSYNMHKMLGDAAGELADWVPSPTSTRLYSQRLETVGVLEAVQHPRRTGANAYELTELGKHTGRPVAGHLLDYSGHYDHSLSEVFGPPNSKSKDGSKPCLVRIGVLDVLGHNMEQRFRIADLAEQLDARPALVGYVVRTMASSGLISTEQLEPNASAVGYIAKEELWAPDLFKRNPSQIYIDIAESIKARAVADRETSVTNSQIAGDLETIYGHNPEERDLVSEVATRTRRLAVEKGVLEIVRRMPEHNARTVAWLEEDQFVQVEDILDIIDGLQGQDPEFFEEGESLLAQAIDDSDTVCHLLDKAVGLEEVGHHE